MNRTKDGFQIARLEMQKADEKMGNIGATKQEIKKVSDFEVRIFQNHLKCKT